MSESVTAGAIESVLPGVFRWEAYSPHHKVNLTSHAVVMAERVFIFDPIRLAEEPLKELLTKGRITAIVLTSGNHERDCLWWREQTGAPIWAAAGAGLNLTGARYFDSRQREWEGWQVHSLGGGGAGELAFRWREQSLIVIGDAVVNLPDRTLELLPDKYCSNPNQLRENLKALVCEPFAVMVMAHGEAVMSEASKRVETLLESR